MGLGTLFSCWNPCHRYHYRDPYHTPMRTNNSCGKFSADADCPNSEQNIHVYIDRLKLSETIATGRQKHCKNCESCSTQVTWKVKFKCQICLSCLSSLTCLPCLSRGLVILSVLCVPCVLVIQSVLFVPCVLMVL